VAASVGENVAAAGWLSAVQKMASEMAVKTRHEMRQLFCYKQLCVPAK
jgi:hypothetical protein